MNGWYHGRICYNDGMVPRYIGFVIMMGQYRRRICENDGVYTAVGLARMVGWYRGRIGETR